ncbi:MAG: hypothetical protein HRT71_10425 [Flavobacteriales bacterium]|nr:hypothetical protein [Flavobacteriales bacterium]
MYFLEAVAWLGLASTTSIATTVAGATEVCAWFGSISILTNGDTNDNTNVASRKYRVNTKCLLFLRNSK